MTFLPFLDTLWFSLATTLPILFWLAAGLVLRRTDKISDAFIKDANYLVFTWCLPVLLFINIGQTSIVSVWQADFLGFAALFVLLSIPLLWWLARWLVHDPSARGVFVQGAYRGNMNVVGLAMVVNAFGASAVPLASVFMAVMTLLFNITAVAVLQAGQGVSLQRQAKQSLTNPIILGVFAGILWSLTGWPLPPMTDATLQGLADLALPIALLCIGASLRWESLNSNRRVVLWASFFKLIALPWLAVAIAVLMGFRDEPLGILFLMMAAPTAAASYVMAKAMTNWGDMAAEIIVVSTLLTLVTTTVGVFILRSLSLI